MYDLSLTSLGFLGLHLHRGGRGVDLRRLAFRGNDLTRMEPERGAKDAMLLCACAATPAISLLVVRGLWTTVALIAIAAAAHQGWSAIFTHWSPTPSRAARLARSSDSADSSAASAAFSLRPSSATGSITRTAPTARYLLRGMAYLAALGIIPAFGAEDPAAREPCTIATYRRAVSIIVCALPETSSPPMPMADAPASRN